MTDDNLSTQSRSACRNESGDENHGLELWESADWFRSWRIPDNGNHPVRVLLAEDNRIDQIQVSRLLEAMGIEVTCVADGCQAVDRFEENVYAFILLDILMPEMDGFEASLHIRNKERTDAGRIPIIALTSCSLNAVFDRCKSVGMNGYLSKPVSARALREFCETLRIPLAGN